VLLDDLDLFPVVALLDTDAWLPSSDAPVGAVSSSANQVRFVVIARPGTPRARRQSLPLSERTLARGYALAAEHETLRLYQRRADLKENGAGR
jgi:hypothetical protein